jgi:hypothetical protein
MVGGFYFPTLGGGSALPVGATEGPLFALNALFAPIPRAEYYRCGNTLTTQTTHPTYYITI